MRERVYLTLSPPLLAAAYAATGVLFFFFFREILLGHPAGKAMGHSGVVCGHNRKLRWGLW